MYTERTTALGFIFTMCFVLIMAVGFVMNIVKFAYCDFEAPYKAEIIRGIGIPCAPMGAIVGWFHISDGEVIKITER